MKRIHRKSASRRRPAAGKTKMTKRRSRPRPAVAARGVRILRMPSVMDKTGWSRATVYRRFGHLRTKLGPNTAGWIEAEIEIEIQKLIAASRSGAATATAAAE